MLSLLEKGLQPYHQHPLLQEMGYTYILFMFWQWSAQWPPKWSLRPVIIALMWCGVSVLCVYPEPQFVPRKVGTVIYDVFFCYRVMSHSRQLV